MSRISAQVEQETTINLYPSQVQDHAEIYSCMPAMINRLLKLAAMHPGEVQIEKEDEVGIFAKVPARWVQIRKPRQMNMSDEQRAAAAERMKAARARKEVKAHE